MIRSTSSAAPVCWCASLSSLTAVASPVTACARGVSPSAREHTGAGSAARQVLLRFSGRFGGDSAGTDGVEPINEMQPALRHSPLAQQAYRDWYTYSIGGVFRHVGRSIVVRCADERRHVIAAVHRTRLLFLGAGRGDALGGAAADAMGADGTLGRQVAASGAVQAGEALALDSRMVIVTNPLR